MHVGKADSAASRAIEAIGSAIEIWERGFGDWALDAQRAPRADDLRTQIVQSEALFAPVRERLDALIQAQNTKYAELVTAQRNARWTAGVLLLGATLILVLVVVQMRRQLWDQIRRGARGRQVIEQQNRALREQRDTLERKSIELEAKSSQFEQLATELASQRNDLEDQAMQLEQALEELRAAEEHQHRLADEALQLNRRLAEAQHVARLGFWEIDVETRKVFWSDEMYRLSGIERSSRPPRMEEYLQLVHPDDRARVDQMVAQGLESSAGFSEQYRLESANGAHRIVLAIGRIATDERGRPKLIGTVQDVTHRAELETQLRQAQKMEAIGALAGGVAHDFNNMLTVIGGYGQLLLATLGEDAAARSHVGEINAATERASRLTQQLLAFSRGRVTQPRLLDLGAIVEDLHPMLVRLAGEHIDFDIQRRPSAYALLDQTQMAQVLMNLVANARDAMPKGGRLTVVTTQINIEGAAAKRLAVSRPGPYVMLSVTDTGIGMDEATQARIFEPFFTTKAEGRGTGLGLSTVFGIVRQSGGTISVQSEPGRGSTFRLCFPAANADGVMIPRVERPNSPAAMSKTTATVLLVEDDAAVRRVTRALLERMGYMVLDAANGIEALAVVKRSAVDIVVSDTVMPKMDGLSLARALTAEHPALPIVLASGYTTDILERHGPIPPELLFIEKPFSPDGLEAVIREGLRTRTAAA